MKKRRWIPVLTVLTLYLALLAAGCGGGQDIRAGGNYTQSELEKLLRDDSVTEITIQGTIGLNRPLEVTGKVSLYCVPVDIAAVIRPWITSLGLSWARTVSRSIIQTSII